MRRDAGPHGSGDSSATAPRWNTSPSTEPRSMTTRTSPSSESMRAWRSAWIVGGTTISPSPPCSRTIASISSTKSGLPAEAVVIRSRSSASSGASATRRSMSCAHSSAPSGSSRSDVAFIFPPPQPGRTSSSSVRAMQRRKIGASRERSATCSTRSMKIGSAHCRSSMTTTCGRSAARASSSRRKASCVSGGDVPITASGLDADREQDLDERPVRDPLAVREAAPAQDVGRVADALEEVGDEARLADAGRAEEREEPARAVGDRVLVVAPEPLALALASDERRLGVAGERLRRRRAHRAAGRPRPAPTCP